MTHAEPYFLRSFAGRPEKLATAVSAMVAGQDVIVPCMVDGDKNALQSGTARIQRLRASLKLQDYDARRDFVGWGGEDFRLVQGMPAFARLGMIGRVDPAARGVIPVDYDGDGKLDVCLFGLGRTMLLQNGGNAFNEVGLPYGGPARAVDFADFDGDGSPDALLATPTGPKLLGNKQGTFTDRTGGLPMQPYYNLTAGAWIDYDRDGRPDILLADRFTGLRLYRNIASAENLAAQRELSLGKWHVIGPFDNPDRRGFDTAYPPERTVNLKEEYRGKRDRPIRWQQRDFPDGQPNSLRIFEDNEQVVAYLYRQLDSPGATELPVSLGSDDGLVVWLNGEKLVSENTDRGVSADSNHAVLRLQRGTNHLLLKVTQGSGDWGFYFKAGEIGRVSAPLFEDVSDAAGLGTSGPIGAQLIATAALGSPSETLSVADINGDDRPDFVFAAGSSILALNTPRGFVPAPMVDLPLPAEAGTLAWGDFDGDGKLDLVCPHPGGIAQSAQRWARPIRSGHGSSRRPGGLSHAGGGGSRHRF